MYNRTSPRIANPKVVVNPPDGTKLPDSVAGIDVTTVRDGEIPINGVGVTVGVAEGVAVKAG